MRKTLLALILATSSTQQVEFDVVSLKPDASQTVVTFGCHGRDGIVPSIRVSVPTAMCVGSVNAEILTAFAYDVGYGITTPLIGSISGEPDWFSKDRYSIQAKADSWIGLSTPPTIAEMRRMLQAMLADRFKLRVHLETKEVDGFVLSVGKDGPRLDAPKPDDIPQATSGFRFRSTRDTIGGPPVLLAKTLNARNVPMDEFAKMLSSTLKQPVVNQTALEGKFTFELPMFSDDETSDPSFPSVFVVLQQKGLRLEKQKVPMTVVVLDHVEKPALN